jgi:hypothetical protein
VESGDARLLDSNILLRISKSDDLQHAAISHALHELVGQGVRLCYTCQTLALQEKRHVRLRNLSGIYAALGIPLRRPVLTLMAWEKFWSKVFVLYKAVCQGGKAAFVPNSVHEVARSPMVATAILLKSGDQHGLESCND